MNRMAGIVAVLARVGGVGCSRNDLSNYSLGIETYPNYPDCKQAYFNGEPIPGAFRKKLNKAEGSRVEGMACHDKTVVVDAKTGVMQEGKL